MFLAFICRELGYDVAISEQMMEEINHAREGTTYQEEEAAQVLYKMKDKAKLTESPFV